MSKKKTTRKTSTAKTSTAKPAARRTKSTSVKKTTAKKTTARQSPASKRNSTTAATKPKTKRAPAKLATAKKSAAKKKPAAKTTPAPRKSSARNSSTKKTVAKKTATRAAPKSKVASTRATTKKAAPKKTVAKKSSVRASSTKAAAAAKKTATKKPAPKTVGAKKIAPKKTVPKKLTPAQKAAEKKKLLELEKKAKEAAEKRKIAAKKRMPSPPPTNTSPRVVRKIRRLQEGREKRKDLAQNIKAQKQRQSGANDVTNDPEKDRLVLIVRDPYWLHVSWEITRKSVTRAKTAIAEHWHAAKPILRLLKVDTSATTKTPDEVVEDIEIHGGVRNWYLPVNDPPSSFRVLLGYSYNDEFHELTRSNTVSTPRPESKEAMSEHWTEIAKDADRIYALSGGFSGGRETQDMKQMFEERLNRPMSKKALEKFGNGAESGIRRSREFHFNLDTEMIVFGATVPGAHVTLGGEPVKVDNDGTFSIRVPMPDKRQVLPATACTRDGVEEQTIVIAVERNTKIMEAVTNDNENELD